jgi:type II secretory pathway pseudopilin PulG
MLTDVTPDRGPSTGIRIYIAVSVVVFLVALAYVGWVFWSRARQNQAIEERVAAQRRAQDAQTVESMGGDRFEILAFYANPPSISRGDSADLCYSVSNAKSVTLEPQSSKVWPSYEHCVSVSPHKTTTYMLTATDAGGQTKSAAVTVEVQ